jgi:hypothetical protein
MSYSEDDIRHAAEVREWLIKQISDKQDEIEKLRVTLSLVDSLLKQGSFRAAAALSIPPQKALADSASGMSQSQSQSQSQSAAQVSAAKRGAMESQKRDEGRTESEGVETRPLRRAKDNFLLAEAQVSPDSVTIIPSPGVDLNANTPPFKSFFINRILEGMKAKDAERAGQGALKQPEILSYEVQEDNGAIKKITINNYREKERLNEIFNTSAWVFTRMLEKAGK